MTPQPTVQPDPPEGASRSARLEAILTRLLAETPEVEGASVVSFDGLPMAAALPGSMDEDRVAAMSAALLSLGERAAEGLGRGELSQVYIEGDNGTVFLVSCDDEAVLVAVAAKGAKAGMMLYEVRRAAATVGRVLRAEDEVVPAHEPPEPDLSAQAEPDTAEPAAVQPPPAEPDLAFPEPAADPYEHAPGSAPVPDLPVQATRQSVSALDVPAGSWGSYDPAGSVLPGEPPRWS